MKKCNILKFDVQVRTRKKEWILAFVLAVKNSNTKEETMKKIKNFLEFVEEGSSGTYNGSDKQFKSFYTFLLEFGVISDTSGENYKLSDLAIDISELKISPEEYLSKVLLNFVEVIDSKVINILKEVLFYLKNNNIFILPKTEVKNIKSFKLDTVKEETANESINQLFTYLGYSKFFDYDKGTKNLIFNRKYNIDSLIKKCNLPKDISLLDNQQSYSFYLTSEQNADSVEKSNKHNTFLPYQKIVYGAPGTGKSYSLSQQTKKYFGDNIKRVTFYDGYTYGQFVGMYKPTLIEGNDIGYSYVPGPFMQQLVQALRNSENNFCLVVEEINRAKADKVFGNIFQLLDRDNSGKSRYPVSISEEQLKFLEIELKDREDILEEIKEKGLYIPNNLYIWATMNSADEGVQPLDTAFKRRWKFEYISLNKNEKEFEKQRENIKLIVGQNKIYNLEWNTFRKTINNKLQEYNITEDRLISPFFISPNDFTILVSEDTYALDKNIFVEKVLMYIFDDLLRHYPRIKKEIFKDDIKTFSKIYEALSNDNSELDDYYKKLNTILSENLFPELFKEEENVSEK